MKSWGKNPHGRKISLSRSKSSRQPHYRIQSTLATIPFCVFSTHMPCSSFLPPLLCSSLLLGSNSTHDGAPNSSQSVTTHSPQNSTMPKRGLRTQGLSLFHPLLGKAYGVLGLIPKANAHFLPRGSPGRDPPRNCELFS